MRISGSADAVYTTNKTSDESEKFIENRRENIKTDLITITQDKLENILIKHLDKLLLKTKWITPLSLALSILATILTSTFKDSFGLSKDIWAAIFYLLFISSIIWLIILVIKLIRNIKSTSIESLIKAISNTREEV